MVCMGAGISSCNRKESSEDFADGGAMEACDTGAQQILFSPS